MAKQVVILGAGSFGLHLARQYESYGGANVTLVTPKDYVVSLMSLTRAVVTQDLSPYSRLISELVPDKVTVVYDKAVSIDEHKITTENNGEIAFDVLVVSTGCEWPDPINTAKFDGPNVPGAVSYFKQEYKRLAGSSDIVIVGGGIVGCELAGELGHVFADEIKAGTKRVSIVHSSRQILGINEIGWLRKSVASQLTEMGINLVLGKRGIVSDGVVIAGHKQVPYDHLIYCTGGKPIVPKNDIANLVNSKGEIEVDGTFRAKAVQVGNIFAVGDVSSYPTKTVRLTREWVKMLVTNINCVLQGTENYASVEWPAPDFKNTCGVSLGPAYGAGQMATSLGTIYLPKFLIVSKKSKDMFAGRLAELPPA